MTKPYLPLLFSSPVDERIYSSGKEDGERRNNSAVLWMESPIDGSENGIMTLTLDRVITWLKNCSFFSGVSLRAGLVVRIMQPVSFLAFEI